MSNLKFGFFFWVISLGFGNCKQWKLAKNVGSSKKIVISQKMNPLKRLNAPVSKHETENIKGNSNSLMILNG